MENFYHQNTDKEKGNGSKKQTDFFFHIAIIKSNFVSLYFPSSDGTSASIIYIAVASTAGDISWLKGHKIQPFKIIESSFHNHNTWTPRDSYKMFCIVSKNSFDLQFDTDCTDV